MKIHLIAIGGSAMHNLALALNDLGYEVTGSDDEVYDPAKSRLKAKGLLPKKMGWRPQVITKDIDVVIVGMHARPSNPELKKAIELELKVVSYPEYIYEQAKKKKRIVIGGSHGKTSTTAMILHVFNELNIDSDYLVGAHLEGFENMVRISDCPLIILEGDEYLSSPIHRQPKFWYYKPDIAVITGIAWDHINVFPTFESYLEQFKGFIERITKGGKLFYYEGDEHLAEMLKKKPTGIKCIKYGTPKHDSLNGKVSITKGSKLYEMEIFGTHNLQNLEAARLVCKEVGISDAKFYQAIASFDGAAKRLQLIKEEKEVAIYSDFAHAPSKVLATVQAIKERYPERDLVACFELHTFSSLNESFINEYKGSLDLADEAVVFYDEHTLKMKKMPPLTPARVGEAFAKDRLRIFSLKEDLHAYLYSLNLKNSNLLMMSSGNFGGLDIKDLAEKVIL